MLARALQTLKALKSDLVPIKLSDNLRLVSSRFGNCCGNQRIHRMRALCKKGMFGQRMFIRRPTGERQNLGDDTSRFTLCCLMPPSYPLFMSTNGGTSKVQSPRPRQIEQALSTRGLKVLFQDQDSLEEPSRTILTGKRGTGPSRFKHIVLQGGRLRRLTPVAL